MKMHNKKLQGKLVSNLNFELIQPDRNRNSDYKFIRVHPGERWMENNTHTAIIICREMKTKILTRLRVRAFSLNTDFLFLQSKQIEHTCATFWHLNYSCSCNYFLDGIMINIL